MSGRGRASRLVLMMSASVLPLTLASPCRSAAQTVSERGVPRIAVTRAGVTHPAWATETRAAAALAADTDNTTREREHRQRAANVITGAVVGWKH